MKKHLIYLMLSLILIGCCTATSIKYGNNNQRSTEPVTIYSHGYRCNKWVAYMFWVPEMFTNIICPNAYITGPLETFNYCDALNPLQTNLGQDLDIEQLHNACTGHDKVILVGTSRGAAAIINYLGTYKPSNVVAAVLESPFAHFNHVLDNVISYSAIIKFLYGKYDKTTAKTKMLKQLFSNYNEDGFQPINTALHIPKDIPILFISSEEDNIIPAWSTKKIYDVLYQSGHTKSHLLQCKKGTHGKIAWGDDGELMRNTIHAFYKYYNIPHCTEWAEMASTAFIECQPSYG